MKKIVVLGLNRSGTKLVSYMLAQAFALSKVYLEPFTWDRGIDKAQEFDWKPQLSMRLGNELGAIEHQRLPIIADGKVESPWLCNLFWAENWDLIKFVEIGRAELYQSIYPDAVYVCLIRNPASLISSLIGTEVQKLAVASQWNRMKMEEGVEDTCPDAEAYFLQAEADCIRAYAALYDRLSRFSPKHRVDLDYDQVVSDDGWLLRVAACMKTQPVKVLEPPQQGETTGIELAAEKKNYIELKVGRVYQSFLDASAT